MARARPEDKRALVLGLKNQGHVVAAAGDGTSEAPAIKEADAGFAMGMSGTEVCKTASDIIIMNDSFAAIPKAVMWGRNWISIARMTLQFMITLNIVALLIILIGVASFTEPPLNPVQVLWINMIVCPIVLADFAFKLPRQNLSHIPPMSSNESLIDAAMWRNIFGQCFYQLLALILILFCGKSWFKLDFSNDTPVFYSKSWCDQHLDMTTCEPF